MPKFSILNNPISLSNTLIISVLGVPYDCTRVIAVPVRKLVKEFLKLFNSIGAMDVECK